MDDPGEVRGIADVHGVEHLGGRGNLLSDDRDCAPLGIAVGDGQRDALTAFADTNDDELAGPGRRAASLRQMASPDHSAPFL